MKNAFNDLADQSTPLLYLARSSRLQREAIDCAERLLDRIHRVRLGAMAEKNAVIANGMLALACLARALSCELNVYLLLKRDEPEKAWNMLVSAQENVDGAMRADTQLRTFVNKAVQLRQLEERLFPPQTFTSVGMLAERQLCSICGQDYDDCEHLAGRPYLGRFCSIKPVGASANHLAIVLDPADRRCRLTSEGVPGIGMRNVMTWEITPHSEGAETSEGMMEAIAATAESEA